MNNNLSNKKVKNEVEQSYNTAFKNAVEYFKNNEFAAKVWVDKYALRDSNGVVVELNPDDSIKRVVKEFARIESKKFKKPLSEQEIYSYMKNFSKIVAQGSPLYGVGNPYQYISVSNCFVVDSPKDSYGSILKTDQELAQISKRRGGVGLEISGLRPNKSPTRNSSHTSTGIIPFCIRYSNTIREVGQDGRRGALMLSCDIRHPESIIVWDNEVDGEPYEVEVKNHSLGNFKISSKHYNPNKIDFITSKYDETKVTGANISVKVYDDFMKAALSNGKYTQQFPIDSDNPIVSCTSSAADMWDKLIHSAWQTAEPGILFWDNIQRESPSQCYKKFGFENISTNPCITGETLVYVADGRGHVSIKELAEAGVDVRVFCYDDDGNITTRMMRNPRITGFKVPVYKIKFDDGSSIRTTSNHKFMMSDGTYKEVKDFNIGDSINTITKYEASIKDVFKQDLSSRDYYWINSGYSKNRLEHRVIYESVFGKILKGKVIHHIDHNSKNNCLSNLEEMTKESHDLLHSLNMIGDKNPMRRAKLEWTDDKWDSYKRKMSESTSGVLNGRYSGVSNEEIEKHALCLTKKIGHRFSNNDWVKYAKENNLPCGFSAYRKEKFGSITDLAIWAANKVGHTNCEIDPRLHKTFEQAAKQYNARIVGNKIFVERKCEHCGKIFEKEYNKREIGFCSVSCSNLYNNLRGTNDKRKAQINNTYYLKSKDVRNSQMSIYTLLKFNLNRAPTCSEWENECKKNNIPFRLGTKHGFKNYSELTDASCMFNHRVVSVEFDGEEDVYNGTVDHFHNFFVGGFESTTQNGKKKFTYFNNRQCGELVLSAYDSCRLLVLNLMGFVKNPFTKDAYFDYKEFFEACKVAQRLMDDLVDIEEECIIKIIEKIKQDPESDDIKKIELDLWNNILNACRTGRRTGTGITALADCLAACNVKYNSEEGLDQIERIYRTLKFGAYSSSVEMAKELGSFKVWDYELEKDNVFLNRFKDEVCDLGNKNVISGKDLYNEMKKHGRRNISLLTTAPVGSMSNLCLIVNRYGTTSGVEPCWNISPYKRRKKGNPGDTNFRSDFVDQNGDHWMEFEIYANNVLDWMEITGEKDIKKSPWAGSCARELDSKFRVKAQGRAQKNICHSISSCITKDSLIETDNGLFYLDELCDFSEIKNGEFKRNKNNNLVKNHNREMVKLDEFYNNGRAVIARVKLLNGLEIKATYNEKLLVLDEESGLEEWKEISEIKEGDRIKIS